MAKKFSIFIWNFSVLYGDELSQLCSWSFPFPEIYVSEWVREGKISELKGGENGMKFSLFFLFSASSVCPSVRLSPIPSMYPHYYGYNAMGSFTCPLGETFEWDNPAIFVFLRRLLFFSKVSQFIFDNDPFCLLSTACLKKTRRIHDPSWYCDWKTIDEIRYRKVWI